MAIIMNWRDGINRAKNNVKDGIVEIVKDVKDGKDRKDSFRIRNVNTNENAEKNSQYSELLINDIQSFLEGEKLIEKHGVSKEDYKSYCNIFESCIREQERLNELISEKNKLEIVQIFYYQNNKIRDRIENFIAYTDNGIKESDDAETLLIKCYESRLSIIQELMKDLQIKYSAFKAPLPERVTPSSFLEQECSDQPEIKLFISLKSKNDKDELELRQLQKRICKNIKGIIAYFTRKKDDIQNRCEMIEKEKKTYSNLYQDLCNLFSNELFDSFDQEKVGDSQNCDEIIARQKELSNEMKKLIEKYNM